MSECRDEEFVTLTQKRNFFKHIIILRTCKEAHTSEEVSTL